LACFSCNRSWTFATIRDYSEQQNHIFVMLQIVAENEKSGASTQFQDSPLSLRSGALKAG